MHRDPERTQGDALKGDVFGHDGDEMLGRLTVDAAEFEFGRLQFLVQFPQRRNVQPRLGPVA